MAANEQVRRSGALTRVAVLDAAERLFAARGYRGTSLEEIGREAGLSRGTPGYFFGSKQRLYAEVLDRILTRAQATLASASARTRDATLPMPEFLEEIVTAHLGVLTADPTLVRLIQWETLEGHGQILGAIGAQAQTFVELIQRLGAASGAGELDEKTATELLVCATAMCWFPLAHADALERTFQRDPHSPEAIVRAGKDDRRVRPDATRDSPLHAFRLAVSTATALAERLSPVSGMPSHLAVWLKKADAYSGRSSTCLTVSKLPCTVLPFTAPKRYQPRLQRQPLSVEGGLA